MAHSTGVDRAKQDHETYLQWLDFDLAGELGETERRQLAAHLEGCSGCREERRARTALDGLLAAGRVAVRGDFRSQVMASLPVAGWEARTRKAWAWPLAVLAALVVAIGALVGSSSGQLAPDGSAVGALGALTDLFTTGALAGAGLLGASWQGIGLITAEALGRIPGGLIAFTVLVVCLHFLLFSLLRRRTAHARAGRRGDSP